MTRIAAAFALWLCAAAMPAFAQNRENLPVVGILRINTADIAEPFATGSILTVDGGTVLA